MLSKSLDNELFTLNTICYQCPYQPCILLWVRERWRPAKTQHPVLLAMNRRYCSMVEIEERWVRGLFLFLWGGRALAV